MPLSARTLPLIQRLGHAGLLPFVLLAAAAWLVAPDLLPFTALALCTYAALIVSFLGGIHWGLAFLRLARLDDQGRDPGEGIATHLYWGVLPSLLAWPGLLMAPHAGLVWQALALIACYLVDRRLYPQAGVASWLTLRFRLTAVAALSCLVAAGAL